MPQPTPKYSDKIYDALQEAYGPNGKLSAGAFSASKDDFIKGLKDSGYVNKIYGALNEAYGADGSLSKGAFTADEPSFRDGMGIGNPLPFYLTSAKPSKSPFYTPPPVDDSADDAMSKDVKGTGNFLKNIWNKLEGSTARMVGGAAHALAEVANAPVLQVAGVPITTNPQERIKQSEAAAPVIQKGISAAEKSVDESLQSKNAAELDKYYTWAGGSAMQKVGAFLGGVADLGPQMLAAAPTGGLSFILPAYDASLRDAQDKGLDNKQAQLHALISGSIVGIVNMIPALGAIDSKIVDKMTSKYATKLLDDAVAANEGNPLTGEQINRLLIGAKNSVMQKFKVGGVKAVKGFLEGGAIGGLGYAGQLATNKLSNEIAGKRVYTTDDFNTGDALNEMLKQGMTFGAIGGVLGFFKTHTGKYVRNKIAKSIDPENLKALQEELTSSEYYKNMPPAMQQRVLENVNSVIAAGQKIQHVPDAQKEYILGLQTQRDGVAAQNEALSARKHPEALKDDDAQTIQSNTDMIALLDDQIEEAAKGQDYVYKVHTDEDGTPHYTKQMEGGQPQEITEGHYDLKNANDDWANSQGGVFVPDFLGEAPEPTLHPILGIPRDHVKDNQLYGQTFITATTDADGNVTKHPLPSAVDPYITRVDHNSQTGQTTTTIQMTGKQADNVEDVTNRNRSVSSALLKGEPTPLMPDPLYTDYTMSELPPPSQPTEYESKVISDNNMKGEQKKTMSQLIGDPVTLDYNGQVIHGTLMQDGQTLVVADRNSNRVHEIGNVDAIGNDIPENHGLSAVRQTGIEPTKGVHVPTGGGDIYIMGRRFEGNNGRLVSSIKRGKNGDILGVTLKRSSDGQHFFFNKAVGQQIAFEILRNFRDQVNTVFKTIEGKEGRQTFDEEAAAIRADKVALRDLANEMGITPGEADAQLKANIGDNINFTDHEIERKDQGSVNESDNPQSNAPRGQGEGGEESPREVQHLTEPESGARSVAPNSLSDEELSTTLGELDTRIAAQQRKQKEYFDAGDNKNADRLQGEVNADISKRNFAEKFRTKYDEAEKFLKDHKILDIDCGGKKFSIRK